MDMYMYIQVNNVQTSLNTYYHIYIHMYVVCVYTNENSPHIKMEPVKVRSICIRVFENIERQFYVFFFLLFCYFVCIFNLL